MILVQDKSNLLILKTLKREPNHGFSITLHVQTASDGFLRVEEGSLYPALRRLERDKLIKGRWKTTGNGRRARYYELMPAGRRRLSEVEQEWGALTKNVSKVLR